MVMLHTPIYDVKTTVWLEVCSQGCHLQLIIASANISYTCHKVFPGISPYIPVVLNILFLNDFLTTSLCIFIGSQHTSPNT